METSILFHLKEVVVVGGFGIHVAFIVAMVLLQGYFTYQQTILINSLDMENYDWVFLYMIILYATNNLLNYATEYFSSNWFNSPFELECERYLLGIKERANPRFLNTVENLQKVIPDGVIAMRNISGSFFNVLIPFIQTVAEGIALYQIIPDNSMVVVFAFFTSFLIIAVLAILYDHNLRKKNQKKTNKASEASRDILSCFVTYVLNGSEKFASSEILKNSENRVKLRAKTELHTKSIYMIINVLRKVVCFLVVYIIFKRSKGSLPQDKGPKIFRALSGLTDKCWWLFHSVKDLIISTESWGAVEDFLSNYVPLDKTRLRPLVSPSQIMKQLETEDEVRLFAESGGGKTTWMKEKVAWVTENFIAGSWAYLEQKMRIPKTNLTIRQFMLHKTSTCFLEEMGKVDAVLCDYADMIGIGNLINHDTLDKTFESPSGGEEKRILSLQAFMPILLGDDKVKVIFCDEITAGLDPKNFEKFRGLVQILKDKGIRFITIEHHDIEATKLEVKKLEIKVPKPASKTSKGIHKVFKVIVEFMNSNDEDNKPKDKTMVKVWIDGESMN
jgi:ABC-type Mn2+/Zn2+ transport system ATPase subunit